jgi:uncharacterized protein YidB (DUF937 family)
MNGFQNMNLLQSLSSLAVSHFSGKTRASEGLMQVALYKLLPSHGNDLDLAALIELFARKGGNIVSLVISWLSDESNLSLDADQLFLLLGDSNLNAFSAEIGLNKNDAASGLAQIIPLFIDQNSRSGLLQLMR